MSINMFFFFFTKFILKYHLIISYNLFQYHAFFLWYMKFLAYFATFFSFWFYWRCQALYPILKHQNDFLSQYNLSSIKYSTFHFIKQFHTIPYHTTPYHTISHYIKPYHIIPYHIISYHIISYHITLITYIILITSIILTTNSLCGKVVCTVCSPSGDKIPGDGKPVSSHSIHIKFVFNSCLLRMVFLSYYSFVNDYCFYMIDIVVREIAIHSDLLRKFFKHCITARDDFGNLAKSILSSFLFGILCFLFTPHVSLFAYAHSKLYMCASSSSLIFRVN